MGIGNIIETVIGLVFVYALFSLFATTLQEIIATRMNRRGRLLEELLASMLDGAKRTDWWWWRIVALFRVSINGWNFVERASPRHDEMAKKILTHGLIWSGMRDDRLPSAIDGDQFARALIEILCREAKDLVPTADGFAKGVGVAITQREPLGALRTIVAEAGGDLDKIRQGLRVWFDTSQDRVSGWYQREVRKVLFCLGLLIAISFNVDSFQLAKSIYNDPALQQRLAAAEKRYSDETISTDQKNEEKKTVDKLRSEIAGLGLPIGYPAPQLQGCVKAPDLTTAKKSPSTAEEPPSMVESPPSTANEPASPVQESADQACAGMVDIIGSPCENIFVFAGWIVSAFAISFGAPFWFDLLSKVMQLRATGPLPPSTAGQGIRPATASPPADDGPKPSATGPRTLFERTGLSETDVRDLQLDLGMPQGLITGELDAATRQAIRERQRSDGVPVTGEVDVTLLERVRKRRQLTLGPTTYLLPDSPERQTADA